ncbi:MAG: hypothetical protein U9P80_10640 [Thermodesulfobacteriota bacterium]|nr:hypothetical protein [Thermodesulfobacteriota bacterium]
MRLTGGRPLPMILRRIAGGQWHLWGGLSALYAGFIDMEKII